MGNTPSRDESSGSSSAVASSTGNDDPDPSPSARRNLRYIKTHSCVNEHSTNEITENGDNYLQRGNQASLMGNNANSCLSKRKSPDEQVLNAIENHNLTSESDKRPSNNLYDNTDQGESDGIHIHTATKPILSLNAVSSGPFADGIDEGNSPSSVSSSGSSISYTSSFSSSMDSNTSSSSPVTMTCTQPVPSKIQQQPPVHIGHAEQSYNHGDNDGISFENTPRLSSKEAYVDSCLKQGQLPEYLGLRNSPVHGRKKKHSFNDSNSQSSAHARHQHGNAKVVDIDAIIKRLKFPLSSSDIKFVCSKAREIFMSQPMLLELAAPVKIAGDIHGQFHDLLRIFKMCGFPPHANYLFMGDYVDRGKQSLETIMLLLCLKIKFPENFFLLRGNHESAGITRMYGFYDECKRRSSIKTWKNMVDVFNTMPVAATIAGRIFCVHGGLSPSLTDLNKIKMIQRPTDIPDEGLLTDLLWSDPQISGSTEGYILAGNQRVSSSSTSSFHHGDWSENDRGVSYCFSKKVVNRFCERFNLDLIVRGHMVVEQGYEFYAKRKLVTVFSAPNYCGEFDNWGAVMNVNKKLMCSFELLKPSLVKQR
ncbi:hypothetical protein HII13_002097 [Brettanomyces bruxellensis]|nr:hypothetical protein HII13_002097 [Brettanomyces bruxellensis]